MAETKRITPEEICEAYRKTGMGICRGRFFSECAKCSCGLGVYSVAELGVSPHSDRRSSRALNALVAAGFTPSYRDGFTDGFDGNADCRDDHLDARHDYDLGYTDGRAAYAAAKENADA